MVASPQRLRVAHLCNKSDTATHQRRVCATRWLEQVVTALRSQRAYICLRSLWPPQAFHGAARSASGPLSTGLSVRAFADVREAQVAERPAEDLPWPECGSRMGMDMNSLLKHMVGA